jgi:DNA-binding SARP family transcriptional activator
MVTATGEVGLRGHAAHLLAWLALHPRRPWAADDLVDRLWPAGAPPTARTALQGHVARLRRTLVEVPHAAIDTVGSGYALLVDDDDIDAHRFDGLVARARSALGDERAADAVADLTAAFALWSGPALADVRDDPGLGLEAAALDARRADAEDELARAQVAAGEIDAAVTLLERLVAAEPLRESRWGQLMVALHRAGRQTDALRAYQRAAAALAEEAGLEPGRELRRLERAILVQDPSLDARRSWSSAALPAPLTRLVGRDAERTEIRERLRSSRLVTLLGPGGVGKTATALDVAAGIAPAFPDGAVVIDLAGASDERSVAKVVSATIGVSESSGAEPLRHVATALDGRDLLVVLDNCEHVVADAARVAVALLQAGAAVRVLATSQERLRVAGEAVVVMEPLAVPDESAGPDEIRRSAACVLLGERLAALGRAPAGDDDWRALGDVARGAGGLPLALEVAASWARVERLDVVARRLRGDEVLGAEPPIGAGRRGLGVALDAAAARLGADARRLYAAASLFPAWFGPDAAAAAAGLDATAARDALVALADVSLALVDPGEPARFRLLPPVRRHAGRLLDDDGGRAAALSRLTAWCLADARDLAAAVVGAGHADAVERFTADLPTWRMILREALDGGRIEDAAALYGRLAFCWASSTAAPEAAAWGAELRRHADEMAPADRVRVEVTSMQTADTFERTAAHLEEAEEALAVAEAGGDADTAARARMLVGIGLGWRNLDLDRAESLFAEAREHTLAAGDSFWAAEARICQGLLAMRRLDLVTAATLLEEALAEHQAVGTPVGQGRALLFLGHARRWMGDLDGARRAYAEARRVLAAGRVTSWLRATVALAQTELAAGDLDAAERAFREAHARAADAGDQRAARAALSGLAAAAQGRGDHELAADLLTAATHDAIDGHDPADAAAAATGLAEVLATADEAGDLETAALLLGAASLAPAEVGVRLDANVATDARAVARRLVALLGDDQVERLRDEGRLLGLDAVLSRADRYR